MINKIRFGSFIREKRIEKGLTQKELGEILFLSESAVSKWEMGKSYPDITLIPDICKALDVSEHELIDGANDTEYRKIKEEARLYRRISETFFWVFTISYITAFIICLICDLCINRRLTFSYIVFGSLLTAFTFIPTCIRFTREHKLALFAGSTLTAIILLFLICCIRLHQNWFGIASFGTILGYITIFSPLLMKKYFPENSRRLILPSYFASVLICLSLLLMVVNITVPFNLKNGFLIMLYSCIPFAVISVMHLVPCGNKIKASVDTFISGTTIYGMQYVVNRIMGIDAAADYSVDFADWVHCINGNTYLLVLIFCTVVSLFLLIAGIKKKK